MPEDICESLVQHDALLAPSSAAVSCDIFILQILQIILQMLSGDRNTMFFPKLRSSAACKRVNEANLLLWLSVEVHEYRNAVCVCVCVCDPLVE